MTEKPIVEIPLELKGCAQGVAINYALGEVMRYYTWKPYQSMDPEPNGTLESETDKLIIDTQLPAHKFHQVPARISIYPGGRVCIDLISSEEYDKLWRKAQRGRGRQVNERMRDAKQKDEEALREG